MEELEIILEEETDGEEEINLESEGELIYPSLENLEVTPSKEQQVFNHKNSYGYDSVIVEPIPDNYIIPEGTISVVSNGEIDVTNYSLAKVDVQIPLNLQDKSITIIENGTQNITYDEGYDGLKSVEIETKIESGKYAPRTISFYGHKGTDLDYELANLDTSNITNMQYLFYQCKQVTSLDLSNLNTNKVTNMQYMFYQCSALTEIDLSSLNFSLVESFVHLFNSCSKLASVIFGEKDAPKLLRLTSMFNRCTALQSVDLSGLNMPSVQEFDYSFNGCTSLIDVVLPKIGETSTTYPNMANAFYGCTLLKNINSSQLYKSRNMQYMFYNCSSLESVDLSNLTISSSTSFNHTFNGCTALKHLDIRNVDTSKIGTKVKTFESVPTDCEIIVKDDTAKEWFTTNFSTLTNVKTVAEL